MPKDMSSYLRPGRHRSGVRTGGTCTKPRHIRVLPSLFQYEPMDVWCGIDTVAAVMKVSQTTLVPQKKGARQWCSHSRQRCALFDLQFFVRRTATTRMSDNTAVYGSGCSSLEQLRSHRVRELPPWSTGSKGGALHEAIFHLFLFMPV